MPVFIAVLLALLLAAGLLTVGQGKDAVSPQTPEAARPFLGVLALMQLIIWIVVAFLVCMVLWGLALGAVHYTGP